MSHRIFSILAGSLIGAAALGFAAPSSADEVADFYKGKTVTLLISTGVGGSNDLNARTVLTHMVKHIPGNPDFKPVNMPGAGHVRASNYLYNRAPKDGTYIGAFVRFYVLHQALGGKGVKYATIAKGGKKICRSYNSGQCKEPCPYNGAHVCSVVGCGLKHPSARHNHSC